MRRRFINNSLGKGYIIIEPLDGNIQFSLSSNSIEYSIDNGASWIKLQAGTLSPSLNVQKVFIRCITPYISFTEGIGTFTIQGAYNLSGDITGLLGGYKEIQPYSFYNLFMGSPVVNVSSNFLPATTLASNCYYGMFYGCTSLTTAPELPATTLANGCYSYMFKGCSKLNYIKMLATDISATNCLNNWVKNVASTGTFVKNHAMTSLPVAQFYNDYAGIPSGWTVVNDGEESGGSKTINHGVITFENWEYWLTFEFPVACNYMTVNCLPQYWEFNEGDTKKMSIAASPEGIGNTIEIYASNYGFDDYSATNEDDTYIYEVTIDV